MRKMLITLVLVLSIFVVGLTTYRYRYYDINENLNFEYIEIKNKKRDVSYSDTLDIETYKEYIITDNLLSINYSSIHENESIKGRAYIGADKYLYLSDSNSVYSHRVSTVKFKTMYIKDYKYDDLYVCIYLISEDDKLYFMELKENDIKKAYLEEIVTNNQIINFVDIDYKSDKYKTKNSLFVLAGNGYIYDIGIDNRYDKDIVSIFDTVYVYGDKTMADIYGNMLEDKNGNYYKIKHIFYTNGTNDLIESNPIIIVTQDNKLLCVYSDMTYTYEFNKKVENIDFDMNYPYKEGNLQITFEDNYKVDFKAVCSEYYCV